MSLDLQKLTIRRLLDTQNTDFYAKLSPKFFTGANQVLYKKLETFYKANMRIPSAEEFVSVHKEASLQDYLESQILSEENICDDIHSDFLVAQLQDFCVREETISFIDQFLSDFEDLEKTEIIDKLYTHLVELNKAFLSSDEVFDIGEIPMKFDEEHFKLYSSGLNAEYDAVNGGFASQELVLLGGRRGSGKSIISLNCARHRFEQGNTVAFFTIEMRYKEVFDRLMSQISGVPFLDIFKNKCSIEQQIKIAEARVKFSFKPEEKILSMLAELKKTKDIAKFNLRVKQEKPPLKNNRFIIIDDEQLTLNKLDSHLNMFSHKFPDFNMSVVDYLNIIKIDDKLDWKSQITIADHLKSLSRKYDLTMMSPYQIDMTGEARFAKGILDSADRSFTFFAKDLDKTPELLEMRTSKIRNGRAMNFEISMDWPCVKIDHNYTGSKIEGELLPGVKFGTDKAEEEARDMPI